MKSKHSQRGFTLVELLVVIGIIAVLISILLPALTQARRSAMTVKCLARMRQLVQATMMYANANQGTLPPIGFCSTTNGAMDRPTIFPAGGEGYLLSYLTGSKSASGYSYAVSLTPSGDLYGCPELAEGVDSTALVSAFSYRYNRVLGGIDKPRKMARYGAVWNATRTANIPWKLCRVRDSTNVALFAEGDKMVGTARVGDAGLDTEPAINANGLFDHNPRSGIYIHQRKAITGGYRGVTNIAYCDGSARSVAWQVDALYPKRVFDSTWISPYYPFAGGFASDNVH